MKLGATIIVRNEARYIEEWILFHYLQGFQYFDIYDNESTDALFSVLDRVKTKVPQLQINVVQWPGKCCQLAAYNNSIEHNKDIDWMFFGDIDEFLFSPTGQRIIDILPTVSDDVGIIAVKWVLFGSNGHENYAPELVIKRFTSRADRVDKHCKCIVRMRDVIEAYSTAHMFTTNKMIVDENGKQLTIPYDVLDGGTADLFRINHYHTKSETEYRVKCLKGRVDTGQIREFEENWAAHNVNEAMDFYLDARYSEEIKKLMK